MDSKIITDEIKLIEMSTSEELITKMIKDPNYLKNGYKILSNYETYRNFYSNLCNIIFYNEDQYIKKLAASILKTFLNKNWSDNNYISNEEKMDIVSIMLSNLHNKDYFMKNFIAKMLGIIAAKEFPLCYEGFVKNLLDNLNNTTDSEMIDTYLRVMINVLNECDDRCAMITGEILPVILNVFKNSTENQKNREKCLKIITQLLNKLSYADGTDPNLITRNLDYNNRIEECIGLFISILVSNPKFLFDIKKTTIRILDILVRDMPTYSSKFFTQLIEPSWRLIVLELSLYTDKVVFGKDINYTEDEIYKMEDENHIYTRGYESDEDDEKYGLEGLILELIDFAVDLLTRKNVMQALKSALSTFLLTIKGYCLLPYTSILLWKDNPNLYITEEFDDENINTVRSKSLNMIKEITKELDDDELMKFMRILISEFTSGVNIDNYTEVIRLDDSNLIIPYIDKLNNDSEYIIRRHEANLLILGNLSDDLFLLKEKNKISHDEIKDLIKFLFNIVSNTSKDYSILVGRAIWCISRLLSCIKHDRELLIEIFEGLSLAICSFQNDLSVSLVASQCISSVCQRLGECKNDNILKNFIRLIKLLQETNEETIIIPIETILYLSKMDKDTALYVPINSSKLIVDIYAQFYNHPYISVKILELVKLWCTDNRSAHFLMKLFVPFAILVFSDFFKTLGEGNKNFEEIKNTVMTEHNGMDFKTNLDMLPNLIDIICLLTKYCVKNNDLDNLFWIGLIVNVLCEILIKSNDVTILQRGTSFLRFYIPLCKDMILKDNQKDIILKVIKRFFDPSLLESSLLFIGNVITQYFTHVDRKLELFVLEAIVKRIYKVKMPSIVQSLILVFSRLINLYPKDILNYLTSIQVENKVGLKILIDKWLLHQPLFRGNYFKNLSIKALTILYEIKNEIVETLMVIGYDPSHSNASVEINAPFKILSVLIRCLNNEILQEKVKIIKNDYENLNYEEINRDDEEDENENYMMNEDNQDEEKKINIDFDEFKNIEEEPRDFTSKLNFIMKGKGGGLGNLETGSEVYLSEMLGFDYNDIDCEEDDDCQEDLDYLNDIHYNFELKDYLFEFFVRFKTNDKEYLYECLKVLPKGDQEMFKNFNI